MSFEVLQAMAQAYNTQKQQPPLLPATIETIAHTYQQICLGEDPWTALGNFTNAWYGYAKHMRVTLISEPPVKFEQETEYTHRWAAFCAASTEFLCERYAVPYPDWIHNPYYILETPWYTKQMRTPSLQKRLEQKTPPPFARRNIFCTNRLFQNKYETYEWIYEAISQGITDPGEIHQYARQKEITIHGT